MSLTNTLWSVVVRKGIEEVGTAAAKSAATEGAKHLLHGITSTAAQTIAVEAFGALGGVVAGPLLRALLKVSDNLSAKIDKQLQASFVTGVRAAVRALNLSNSSSDEEMFRRARLNFAMDELERAWTLAAGLKTEGRDRFVVRLLQGSCALSVSGGSSYAKAQFNECIPWLDTQMQQLATTSATLEQRIQQIAEIEDVAREVPPPNLATMRAMDSYLATMELAVLKRDMRKQLELECLSIEKRRAAAEALRAHLIDVTEGAD